MAPRSPDDDFGDRLRSAMERGDLTINDIAHWFDRPISTVRYWTKHGHGVYALGSVSRRALYSRLVLLENFLSIQVRVGDHTIVPNNVPRLKRPDYIVRLRDELERLSAADSAR